MELIGRIGSRERRLWNRLAEKAAQRLPPIAEIVGQQAFAIEGGLNVGGVLLKLGDEVVTIVETIVEHTVADQP